MVPLLLSTFFYVLFCVGYMVLFLHLGNSKWEHLKVWPAAFLSGLLFLQGIPTGSFAFLSYAIGDLVMMRFNNFSTDLDFLSNAIVFFLQGNLYMATVLTGEYIFSLFGLIYNINLLLVGDLTKMVIVLLAYILSFFLLLLVIINDFCIITFIGYICFISSDLLLITKYSGIANKINNMEILTLYWLGLWLVWYDVYY